MAASPFLVTPCGCDCTPPRGTELRRLWRPMYKIYYDSLTTSDSEAGVKTGKLGGVAGREGECGDDVAGWLVRERRSLDILPVIKRSKAVCT